MIFNTSFSTDKIMHMKNHTDLLLVIMISLVTVGVVIVLPEITTLRVVFGIPFIILCPGYALVSFLWPKMDGIDLLERLALSFGLSIAIVVLIGLGLNYTPGGISLTQILFSISFFNIIFCILALIMRQAIPNNNRYTFTSHLTKDKGSAEFGLLRNLVIAIVLISVFICSIFIVVSLRAPEPFTEFYVLNHDGMAQDYPKDLLTGENGKLIIGVANHEGITINYNVTVIIYNENNEVINNTNHLIRIDDTEIYEFEYLFNMVEGGKYRIQFLLYKNNDPAPALELHLNNIMVED